MPLLDSSTHKPTSLRPGDLVRISPIRGYRDENQISMTFFRPPHGHALQGPLHAIEGLNTLGPQFKLILVPHTIFRDMFALMGLQLSRTELEDDHVGQGYTVYRLIPCFDPKLFERLDLEPNSFFSARTANRLAQYGLTHWADLLRIRARHSGRVYAIDREDMGRDRQHGTYMAGFGRKCHNEVLEIMREYGIDQDTDMRFFPWDSLE